MGLKDKEAACCARWELRNLPDPTVLTTQEKSFLDQAKKNHWPLNDRMSEHVCTTMKLLGEARTKGALNKDDLMQVLPDGDSTIRYKVYCNGA